MSDSDQRAVMSLLFQPPLVSAGIRNKAISLIIGQLMLLEHTGYYAVDNVVLVYKRMKKGEELLYTSSF